MKHKRSLCCFAIYGVMAAAFWGSPPLAIGQESQEVSGARRGVSGTEVESQLDFGEVPAVKRGSAGSGSGKICKDLCGDGRCQEIVCMGSGCPCAEDEKRCPQDCKGERTHDE